MGSKEKWAAASRTRHVLREVRTQKAAQGMAPSMEANGWTKQREEPVGGRQAREIFLS